MKSNKLKALALLNELTKEVETVRGQVLIGQLIDLIGVSSIEQKGLRGGEQNK